MQQLGNNFKTRRNYLKIPRCFGLTVLDLARKKRKKIGITPAMPSGSSLKFMMDAFQNVLM
jgi:deoxyxylulose-5-phosphate synthase